jgi:hypothetical protein
MAQARIYQRMKNSMQSGRSRVGQWVLEYERAEPQRPDPLTGWAGSGDTRRQVQLSFPTLDAARTYAEREGLSYDIVPMPERALKIRTYAENFR